MAFIIPTIFTASNQLSRPLAQMQQGMQNLATTANGTKRALQGMMSVLGEDTNNRLNYMISLGKAMAVTGTALFAGKSLMDYDRAITKFRTIVSDLNDTDFGKFKKEMNLAAKSVNASAVEMFQAAEVIAGLDEKFAANPALLADMSKAAYTLSKGGFMELADAAEGMTGIMLQFNMQAAEADRVINALAAGTAKGGASISSQIESLRKFGSEAYRANMSLELTVATLQAIAPKVKAAEAGDALSIIMGKMRKAGVGYRGGVFDFIAGIDDLNNRMKSMNEQARNLYSDEIFGADRASIGSFLLTQRDNIMKLNAAVTATNEAHRAAQIASSSLGGKVEAVKNKFVNFVTQSERSNYLMTKFGNLLSFVSDNFTLLMQIATPFVSLMVVLKGYVMGAALALKVYTGFSRAYAMYQGIATVVTRGNVFALRANTDAMYAASRASKFLNLSLGAQIALSAGAALALGALLYILWPTTDATDALATSVDATGKSFADLGRPITDAEARLALFNKEKKKFIDQENAAKMAATTKLFEAKGAIRLNPLEEIRYSMQQAFKNNPLIVSILPYFSPQPMAPNPLDYGITQPIQQNGDNFVTQAAQVSVPQAVNRTTTNTTTNKDTVEITVSAAPGSEAKVSSNTGGIPVRTTQTAAGR
jgi:TP901 family phage tail tape measure protein